MPDRKWRKKKVGSKHWYSLGDKGVTKLRIKLMYVTYAEDGRKSYRFNILCSFFHFHR